MAVRVGALRKLLDLQQPTEARGSRGGIAVDYETIAQVHAKVEPLAGREYYLARATSPNVSTRITIRYRDDMSPRYRFVLGTRAFNILSVTDLEERHRWIVCDCEEVPA